MPQPAPTIRHADVLNCLTTITNQKTNPISGSPYGEWWSHLSYGKLASGQVPGVGVHLSNLLRSAFSSSPARAASRHRPDAEREAVHHRHELHREPTRRDDDLRGDDPSEHRVVA